LKSQDCTHVCWSTFQLTSQLSLKEIYWKVSFRAASCSILLSGDHREQRSWCFIAALVFFKRYQQAYQRFILRG